MNLVDYFSQRGATWLCIYKSAANVLGGFSPFFIRWFLYSCFSATMYEMNLNYANISPKNCIMQIIPWSTIAVGGRKKIWLILSCWKALLRTVDSPVYWKRAINWKREYYIECYTSINHRPWPIIRHQARIGSYSDIPAQQQPPIRSEIVEGSRVATSNHMQKDSILA